MKQPKLDGSGHARWKGHRTRGGNPKSHLNETGLLQPPKPIVPINHLDRPTYSYGYYRCKWCLAEFEGTNAEHSFYLHLQDVHGRNYN